MIIPQNDWYKKEIEDLSSTKDNEIDALHQELTMLNQLKQQHIQQISTQQETMDQIKNEASKEKAELKQQREAGIAKVREADLSA